MPFTYEDKQTIRAKKGTVGYLGSIRYMQRLGSIGGIGTIHSIGTINRINSLGTILMTVHVGTLGKVNRIGTLDEVGYVGTVKYSVRLGTVGHVGSVPYLGSVNRIGGGRLGSLGRLGTVIYVGTVNRVVNGRIGSLGRLGTVNFLGTQKWLGTVNRINYSNRIGTVGRVGTAHTGTVPVNVAAQDITLGVDIQSRYFSPITEFANKHIARGSIYVGSWRAVDTYQTKTLLVKPTFAGTFEIIAGVVGTGADAGTYYQSRAGGGSYVTSSFTEALQYVKARFVASGSSTSGKGTLNVSWGRQA